MTPRSAKEKELPTLLSAFAYGKIEVCMEKH
jgi:hypothetical protein